MDNPGIEALDVIEDLISEEQWLRSQTTHHPGAQGTDHRHRDRLQSIERDLDRCAELLHRRGTDRNSQHRLRAASGM